MKKVLLIDRDGTLIVEPPIDFQIDSLEKLEFIPNTISGLKSIVELKEYELVMATNQDGLGTDSFPENTFWPAHNKMLKTFEGESVVFDDILIDRSFEYENSPNRKPRTGMFGKYLNGTYNLAESYVIGDRITDVKLAKNLGTKAILFQPEAEGKEILKEAELLDCCVLVSNSWAEIALFLNRKNRTVAIHRKTRETDILLTLDLDGRIESKIDSGLKFLDHMLDQLVHHAGIGIQLKCTGDLQVDEHHTTEDIAIVLGQAAREALGNKRGIERYGFALPMDESSALILIDFGGRIEFVWDAEFKRENIGDLPTEMLKHFFKSFAQSALCNLHISAKGENEHHKAEGIFKAFARALKAAIYQNPFRYELPSSKGVL